MKKQIKEWKKPILLLFLLLFVAFFIRAYNLTTLPVFADEAIYIRWAQVMRAEQTLRFLPLSDGKQPLFMWSVIPFLKVFNDPLLAARLLSVFTGIGSLVGVFAASYLLFDNKKVALISGLIYAISPFSVFFDRMALVDSMLTMFGVFSFLGSILIIKTKRLDVAMLTGFALGGAFLTKSPSIFYTILFPFSLFLLDWSKGRKKILKEVGQIALLWLTAFFIGYAMYNIQRLGPNFHLLAQRNKDYVYPLTHFLKSPFDPFIPFIHRIYQYFISMGPGALLLLSLLGVVVNFSKKKGEILTTLSWGLLPILINAEFAKTMTARYVYFTLPYFFILTGSAFLAKKELFKNIFVVLLAAFIIHSLYINYFYLTNVEEAPLPRSERSGYLEEWTAGTGIKEIGEYIVEVHKNNPEMQIVVGTEGYFGTLPDGLQFYLNPYKDIVVKGVGLGLNSVPKELLDSKKSGNEVFLVANNTRLSLNPEETGLEIVAAYPKAVRPDGSRQTLLLLKITKTPDKLY